MYQSQSKCILANCDVVFMEDAISMCQRIRHDLILPLFDGGNVRNEAQIHPLYSFNDGFDQPFFDIDAQDALDEERDENESAKE